ncbi:MAG: diaminopimelate epimerase [Candidatus Marinimicrobia bacterium]|nr:diaminopimelate epimerase [Candidatus Neomarinimicrobiota bacterium]
MQNKNKILFTKLEATGNDFILIDLNIQKLPDNFISLIPKICDRHFGIGADGVLLIEKNESFPFKMTYFNSDGSKGKFCGNGSRALVKYAFSKNWCANKVTFIADDGIHDATISKDNIAVSMSVNEQFQTFKFDDETHYKFKVGVNHFVIPVENIKNFDIVEKGKYLHEHPRYKAFHSNFNFIKKISDSKIRVRTFENGVNNETLSCATGGVASSILANNIYKMKYPIISIFNGGNIIIFKENNKIWLKGKTKIIYNGEYFYE